MLRPANTTVDFAGFRIAEAGMSEMRFPNRSAERINPVLDPSLRCLGTSHSDFTKLVTRGTRSDGSVLGDSHAATGARTSRPGNVCERRDLMNARFVTERTDRTRSRVSRSDKTPLSGARKRWRADSP